MKVKSLYAAAATALLFAVAGSATAGSIYRHSSASLNAFTPHVLPVLVKVNDQGKVTSMSPAFELRPQYRRLLHKTLDQIITQPAHNKDGRAINSQFIINMAMKTTPRDDGKYNLRFAYVSTKPVPYGSWYWGHIDGHRLALISQNHPFRQHRIHRWRPDRRRQYSPPHIMRSPAPAMQQRNVQPRPAPVQRRSGTK